MNITGIKVAPSLVSLVGAVGISAAASPMVAPVHDQQAIRGCSWNASAPSVGAGFLFLAERDDSKILMNIDGSDVMLKLTGERGKLERLGDILERTYQATGVQVKARYKVTSDCSSSRNESCEVTGFAVTFEVSKKGHTQSIEATGTVGC